MRRISRDAGFPTASKHGASTSPPVQTAANPHHPSCTHRIASERGPTTPTSTPDRMHYYPEHRTIIAMNESEHCHTPQYAATHGGVPGLRHNDTFLSSRWVLHPLVPCNLLAGSPITAVKFSILTFLGSQIRSWGPGFSSAAFSGFPDEWT
ncbi:hypothetical protein BDZ45DRAFT_152743 [Acephala macrosclerotiorum]|nr:hypothetical protein BDZ45DRAFT_152743 [Acephala macrosclerotiorum]